MFKIKNIPKKSIYLVWIIEMEIFHFKAKFIQYSKDDNERVKFLNLEVVQKILREGGPSLQKKGRALGFREFAHIFCQVFQCMINVCMVRLAEQQFHAKTMLFLLLSFPIYGHKEISTKSFF